MKCQIAFFLFFVWVNQATGQNLYFPSLSGNAWETLSPDSLGWCPEKIDSLYLFLESKHTKAFIVLKDGRIVLEKYFGDFQQNDQWYWASAGKTLTAFLTGISQKEGYFQIDNPTADYLGNGWTACPAEKESLITIRHQLTMTSGLDDGVPDHYCTLDTCLQYLADAGTRWAYHNAPYTLLDQVIEQATGQNYNLWFAAKVKSKTGMKGLWVPVDYNNVYFSDARSMARFGLLIQNEGSWAGTPVLDDPFFFQEMINTSQNLNPSYGYLWWLNGKSSFKVPGLQLSFNGSIHPDAPDDMFSAMGKDGQILNIVPSQGLVMVRMGENPGTGLLEVTWVFNNDIWLKFNDLTCETTRVGEKQPKKKIRLFPNPAAAFFQIGIPGNIHDFWVEISDVRGRVVLKEENIQTVDLNGWVPGIYFCRIRWAGGAVTERIMKQ